MNSKYARKNASEDERQSRTLQEVVALKTIKKFHMNFSSLTERDGEQERASCGGAAGVASDKTDERSVPLVRSGGEWKGRGKEKKGLKVDKRSQNSP